MIFKVIIVSLIVLGAVVLIGAIVAWVAIRRARDGFEDDDGFHPTNHSNPR